MKKSLLLTILLGLLLISAAAADPGDTLWTRTYGGSDGDGGLSVQQTTDGGYIIAGYTRSFGGGSGDLYLVKTDADGDTLWTSTFGGGHDEFGHSVQQTADGGYIVAGYKYFWGSTAFDYWLVKTDADGGSIWTQAYGGDADEYGACVDQTSDGGYIVTGETYSFGAGNRDIWVLKTDADGDTLWARTYGGTERDYGKSILQTTDGGYLIGGYTTSFGAGSEDVYLVKTDADGNVLWTRTYGGTRSDGVHVVQQTSDGGYIAGGYTGSFGAGNYDFYLLKTDSLGDTLWTRAYGGSDYDFGYSLDQTSDGGYILCGITKSYGAGDYDFYLVRTDANGDTLWTRAYGGSAADWGYSVQQTSDGGYVVTGHTSSFGAGAEDVWLLRLAGEAPEPDVSIEIIPDDPPVTVPQGGSFGFTGNLTNNTEEPQVTDAWIMAIGPQKETYGPFKEFSDVELDPYETRSRHFDQDVPNVAPLGFYDYIAYCGEYPSTVIDSSFFPIEVIAGPLTKAGEAGWVLTGSFSEGDLPQLPSDFALVGNYPNPFNANTVISYELPLSGHVKLEIYNLFGQKVATLVDDQQEAGYGSVTWEASEVSSGIYFYKLTAGDFTEVKRMTLLR